ncbi:MAG: site-specific integrase [Deinococcota bacterium]|jgi:integrase|nr:site-specific integrase [Deinococcota bacterium]
MSRRRRGEGTIRPRPDGRWEARVTVGYKPNGYPIQRSVYAKTEDEAIAKRAALITQHRQSRLTEPSKATVAEWLEHWLKSKTHLAEKSRNNYRQELQPVIDALGRVRLQALKPAQIQGILTSLASTPRKQGKAATHLRAALKEAVQLEVLVRNPAEAVKVRAPRVAKGIKAWSRDEASRFLQAARGELVRKATGGRATKGGPVEVIAVGPDDAEPASYYPIYFLLLLTGLRRGEALGLPWSAVDFEQGSLRVTQTLSITGKGSKTVLKEVKTPHSRRTLYVGRDVLSVLRERRERQEAERRFMGSGWQDRAGLVFTTPLGTPIGPRNLDRAFKGLVGIAGVKPISLHGLRHTHASLALQRGVPVEVLSKRLGHARVDITLNLYRHVYDAELREAALTFEELMGQPRAPG